MIKMGRLPSSLGEWPTWPADLALRFTSGRRLMQSAPLDAVDMAESEIEKNHRHRQMKPIVGIVRPHKPEIKIAGDGEPVNGEQAIEHAEDR